MFTIASTVQGSVPQALAPRELQLSLFLASQLGHVDVLRALVVAGVAVGEARDNNNNTPLYVAVANNQPQAAQVLAAAARTVINTPGGARNTPVHEAARLGHEECLHVLLEHGTNVDSRDSSGNTPLILAVRHKRYSAIKALLEAGCDVDVKDNHGRTALHYACHTATAVPLLLTAGADVNVRDKEGCVPLMMAATEGLSHVVRLLSGTGRCDVNLALPESRRTPLHLLAYKGHAACIPDLIAAGADINLYDGEERTALWYAVSNGRVDVVKLLLRANSQADTFRCPHHLPPAACPIRMALTKGLVDVIKLFILTGYDSDHLRDCLSQSEAITLFEQAGLQHWLLYARDVMSLRSTCRKWIRHHLGYHLYQHLQQLPVPPAIRDYLFLAELDDAHDHD
ncbi:hypothetical protein BaRGS_00013937 [Batillaria attramentaria]|uniref:SOCS box domain-containing protein n=1 Tax=Batillaria attramentaria TaxID=370345 RepID=A0ABD0L676_9CAEN